MPTIEALVDAAARSHSRALLLLVAASLLSFLPGFFQIPPVDRDEARFAQATKQMIESGNYAEVRFRDEGRYRKPPGIYWLQAGAVRTGRALGLRRALTTIWVYRLPSLAGAIGAVWLTYWAALALVSRRAAVLAGLLMAASVLLGVEARLATTDAMVLLTAVAAMGGLARAYMSRHGGPPARWTSAAVFWTALAAGALLKGPVVPAVAALTAATLGVRERSARWMSALRPVAGLVWFAALTLPWLLLIRSRAGGAFTLEWAGDIFPRLFTGMEGHGAPPGYYVVLFCVTFWPGCALAGLAAPAVLATRRTPATAFLLAWLLPSWIAAELAVTKLPHYVLPLYPSVAMLVADAIGTPGFSRRPALLKGAIWLAVMPLAVGVLSLAALVMIERRWDPLAWLLGGSAVVAAMFGWRQLVRHRAERALLLGVVAAWVASGSVYGVVVPGLRGAFPSAALVELIETRGCAESMTVTPLTYDEPSLVFLLGTRTRATDVPGAVAFLAGGPCRFALVDGVDQDRFSRLASAAQLRYEVLGSFAGFNYSNGTTVTLSAYSSPSAEWAAPRR